MRRRTRTIAAVLALALACAMPVLAIANQAPVARISAYRTGGATAVQFDGSGSTDSDGQVVRHQWLFGDGTTGSGASITHNYPHSSSFTVTLLVGDNGGATSVVTQVIDVASLPTANAAPTPAPATAAAPVVASTLPVGNRTGQRAPEIALPSMDGGMVYLSSYLGRAVLVEFWLSTCPGCQTSTPQLEAYRTKYAADGLVVMLVVLDRAPSAAVAWLERYGYTNLVLAWESSAAKPTRTAYGVAVTPHAFLVDPTGVIRYSGHPSGLSDDFLIRWL